MVISVVAGAIGFLLMVFNKQAANKLVEQEMSKAGRQRLYAQAWVVPAVRGTFVVVGLAILAGAILKMM